MACFQGNIFSHALRMETQLYVSLPQDGRTYNGDANPKTLILLHGISDNAAGWVRRGRADYFADKYGVALVMPEVQRSFYQDMRYGMNYYSYISEELPELIGKLFKASTKRGDLMIAGLSMGGYGAMRVALDKPERFACCGAFSAACDLRSLIENREEMSKIDDIGGRFSDELAAIFGMDHMLADDKDLYKLAEKISNSDVKPRLYLACGTEDIIHKMNFDFAEYCKTLPLDFKYEQWQGIHDWDFWDAALEKFLILNIG